ncbi:MAG TPA: O-antigen ligase family protein [Actinomycetota bacterium]|nr:O-antigen ligase family protein [Actinomycetota bacterium]
MTERHLPLPSDRRFNVAFAAAALGVAAVIGALVPLSPTLAIGALVAVIVAPTAVVRPRLIPHILIVTVAAAAVTIGGVTIGRLAAPIALVAVISQAFAAPIRLRDARLTLGLVTAYGMLAIASIAWTVNLGVTVNTLASLAISLAYMGAFATLIRSQRELRALMRTMLASSLVLGYLWITQFASGVDRRFSKAGDPNFLSAFQIIVLPLIVVLASTQFSLGRRILLYCAIAVIADSVISTLSRGGFITLAVVVALLALLPSRTLFSSRREKVAFFTAAAVGLALLLPLAWGPLARRFEQGFAQSNVAGGRGDLWLAALHGYESHPVTGLGYGGFEATSFQLLRSTPGVNLRAHLRFREGGEFVHNAYLGSLAELGPLGLALFVGILAATGRSLRRTARRARAVGDSFLRSVANALLIGLLAFSLSSVLLSTETSRSLWLIVGMSLALPRLISPPRPEAVSAEVDGADLSTAPVPGSR